MGGSQRRRQHAEQERGEEVTPGPGRAADVDCHSVIQPLDLHFIKFLCSDDLGRFEWSVSLLVEERILTDKSRNLSNLGATNYLGIFF